MVDSITAIPHHDVSDSGATTSIPVDSAGDSVAVGASSTDFGLSDNESLQSPRSTNSSSSRSSKRANSSTSVNDRNKFRTKLDGFLSYTTSSPNSSSHLNDKNNVIIETTSDPPASSAEPHNTRHYSASSVTNHSTTHTKDLISPLDYFYSSKLLDPLFPIKLINQSQLKSLLNLHYSKPLPDCDLVFPWLHGIHHSNHNQREFLSTLANFTTITKNNFDNFRNQTEIPSHYRGLIPVRSGCIQIPEQVHESSAILKGSICPNEILCGLDVSKQDLLILLNGLLKELKLDENNSKEQFESILENLFDDCQEMNLLPIFKNLDPQKGISLRNFQIQVSKVAQISDFIVYCFNDNHSVSTNDGSIKKCQCCPVSRLLYFAQLKHSIDHPELVDSLFSTLLLEKNDIEFYAQSEVSKNLLAIDKMKKSDTVRGKGNFCSKFDLECFENWDMNYLLREKFEISKMSSATPINGNVWVGNSTDFEVLKLKGFNSANIHDVSDHTIPLYVNPENSTCVVTKNDLLAQGEDLLINPAKTNWKTFAYCCDGSTFPELSTLRYLIHNKTSEQDDILLNFPPSGSIGIGDCTDTDLISIINTCKLIYIKSSPSRPTLIHCSDGYTESSLLVVCYMIYSTGNKLKDVAMDLHKLYGRPFFLFPTDVQLITRIEDILIHYSPVNLKEDFHSNQIEVLENSVIYKHLFMPKETNWYSKLNGSLPSRILPHLYLGSLNHANAFELLESLGITKIVSVGENLSWLDTEDFTKLRRNTLLNNQSITVLSGFTDKSNPINEVMCVSNIQDDGIDMLTHTLSDILEFIDKGYKSGEKILVHCRVGVSRSATVCIAEVMRRLNINLIRAYIYVRVRRLNIIIQPNLRFMYELFKWEESERLIKFAKLKKNKVKRRKIESVADSPTAYSKGLSGSDMNRLSGSISSFISASDVSADVNIDNLIDPGSPVRAFHGALDSKTDDEDDTSREEEEEDEEEYDNDDEDGEDNIFEDDDHVYWLRDVDWHVLCREIDLLNKAYIRA